MRTLPGSVRRNLERFPEDFAFPLTLQEFRNLKSQTGISSWGGRRKPPWALTEQGIAMLSSVLRSPLAVQVNIQVMRAFVRLRELMLTHRDLARKLAELEKK
jgi:ORF6N domain